VGATLDETRVELEAQRARVRATADDLQTTARRSLDLRELVGRNPARTVAVVGGLAFILIGGPRRTIRAVRQAVAGSADAERAYASLPPTLRAFVDDTAPHGGARDQARGQMALALHAWREDPKNRKKADRLVSEALTPPGPRRVFWEFTEAVAVAAAALVARQIITKALLAGTGGKKNDEADPSPSPSGESADAGRGTKPAPTTKPAFYAGWSGRHSSTAGPGETAGGSASGSGAKPASAASAKGSPSS
jgi:hypothetical protein